MFVGLGPYMLGIAFWMFVGAVSIAGIISDYQKRRLNVELLRTILDKGQALDPALVTKLISPDAALDRTDPTDLKLGGIIVTAAGIGIFLMSYFVARVAPVALYPIMAGGIVTICVGISLLIGAKVVADAREREERPGKSTP
ncbi:MAG TPA: hypothetical protein VK743_13830 [Steroidobacteraceae bacterium]|jgi:hypothetical protein|nr:hypothetical protein [Steroidobacteraceae bacterium]